MSSVYLRAFAAAVVNSSLISKFFWKVGPTRVAGKIQLMGRKAGLQSMKSVVLGAMYLLVTTRFSGCYSFYRYFCFLYRSNSCLPRISTLTKGSGVIRCEEDGDDCCAVSSTIFSI